MKRSRRCCAKRRITHMEGVGAKGITGYRKRVEGQGRGGGCDIGGEGGGVAEEGGVVVAGGSFGG